MIVGIDTVASDDDNYRGTGRGGGEKQGWIVGQEKYTVCTNCYVWWQIWECQVTGGRGGVCMCTGMTNAIFLATVILMVQDRLAYNTGFSDDVA
jgi:hypothetical protein